MVIDVRTRDEWNAGHHREAQHIPLGELPRALATLPRDRPIAVYCQHGTRAAVASSLLSAAGIEAAPELSFAQPIARFEKLRMPSVQKIAMMTMSAPLTARRSMCGIPGVSTPRIPSAT